MNDLGALTIVVGIFLSYLVYLIFALIFKHNKGFIISLVWLTIAGIYAIISRHDYYNLISSVIAHVLIFLIIPIQIKRKKDDKQ